MLNRLKANLADFFQQADLVLLALCCTATMYGIVLIFSATRYLGSNKLVVVQFVAMLLGICMYITFSMVDLEVLMKRWKWVLAFNILFILLLRTPLGISRGGNRAWLKFPGIPVNIGPAEVVKITFVLLLAKQLEWLREEKRDLKSFPSALMVGAHAIGMCGFYFLVSGDMGNGLVFLFIFICMAFVAGFALRWFVLLIGGGTAAVAAAWKLGIMPDYMQGRFLALFDHNYDPLGVGWHQNRSLLTLGAGGWFGQGYLKGTQTQSADSWSLPGRHTDFIFSVCGEELGLVGCLAVIALLAAIIIRVLLVAKNSQTSFYCCVCVGMAAMLIFQTLINIGMCLFIMPTIGITLPFFSYGGSSIVTLFAAMGVVSGIKKRSPTMRRPGRPIR
ncbi:MAG: FtsW/RodA/SpoVE family cell cycle protein [Dysosmobacter sp.]|nr:FtsW/RodA/SpoVE family cell cycle protein [Dysosmobacter sp.]